MNDGEDDLQPLVYTVFDDAVRSLRLLEGVLSEAQFHTAAMAAKAGSNFLTVTELADTLTRVTSMDFRKAHEIVAHAVKELEGSYDSDRMAATVERLLLGSEPPLRVDPDTLREALTAENFVAVRSVRGGPAPAVLHPEIQRARECCIADRAWLHEAKARLSAAEEQTRHACDALRERFA